MSSTREFVSIILPVFNGAQCVSEAIRSIQYQTYENWELIILDDWSSDNSLNVCRSFAQIDKRIKVFGNPQNLGLAKTMNRLVSLAKGKYIAVQEQDDISMRDRLVKEVEVLDTYPNVGLVSGLAAWLDDEGRVFTHFPGVLARGEQYPQNKRWMVRYLYLEQCKVVNAACMFRRSITDQIQGPFDERAKMSIDWQFFLHIAHVYHIRGISRVLVKMRRGRQHDSLTKNKFLQFNEARRCINLIYNCYKNNPESPINYWLYRKAMTTQLILEGRYLGGKKGYLRLLQALLYDPVNQRGWQSLFGLSGRGIRKFFSSASNLSL